MYVRLIHAVDDNGNEYVYFTEDFDSKLEDFLRPGYKAYFDKKSMLICLAVFRWTMSSKKYSNKVPRLPGLSRAGKIPAVVERRLNAYRLID